jgi:alpha-ketoglutarate-dependent 2,4-dichlorophenoxyacetate dioxygenase
MTLRITALHPHIGARAEGVDLREPLSAELRAAIAAAMDRHAVLVFPGQELSDAQHMAFGTAFGPVEHTRATVDAHRHRLSIPEMNDISNLDVDGQNLKADDRRRLFELGNRLWHSDSSFKATPAKYSLRAHHARHGCRQTPSRQRRRAVPHHRPRTERIRWCPEDRPVDRSWGHR